MAKVALLIGGSEYLGGLSPLPSAVLDAEAIRQVLVHPETGGFVEEDVTVLNNPQRQEMAEAIEHLFAGRRRDDLVLLYFSGHGIKDDQGKLFFATASTRKHPNGELVRTTAVEAALLHDHINRCRSQRQVVVLDSCFSGAIAQGMTVKDDGVVNIQAELGGKGRAILTSSAATEYSFGADSGARSQLAANSELGLSVYTRYLVEGIEKGTADADEDGLIAVDEWHEYAAKRVKEAAPTMKPKFFPVEEGYKIIVARSPKDDPKLKFRKEVQKRFEHGQGQLSSFAKRMLEGKCKDLGLSEEVGAAIIEEEWQPYLEYQRKLQEYEEALIEAAHADYPFSSGVEADLKDYRKYLGLSEADIVAIEVRILPKSTEQRPQYAAAKI